MKRIVLAGAGHANIAALRLLSRRPPRAEIILVNDGPFAWYTGALPALIRGDIPPSQARIDLAHLAATCGAQFINARVTGFTTETLLLDQTAPLPFGILALSTGGTKTPGGVKPIPVFLDRIATLAANPSPCLGIIGAGAAGIELALALRIRLGPSAAIHLQGPIILPTAPARAQRIAARALHFANIAISSTLPPGLDDTIHAYTPPPDMQVGPDLLIPNHQNIFATGDCAHLQTILPRSGAIAVRQGRVLARNIRHLLSAEPLQTFQPSAATLAIMSLNRRIALAWYGTHTWHGHLPMLIKTRLDKSWLA